MLKRNKTIIIVVLLALFLLLAWAPWMNNRAIHDRVSNERAKIDGTLNRETGELMCDYNVMWFPFGRLVVSCEGGYFITFWGKLVP